VAALELQALSKQFGTHLAVDRLSLSIPAGMLYAFLGANGAGKTTLLRTLAGLTAPETGVRTLNGRHHWLGHADGLKPHETPQGHLALWATAWGSETNIPDVLETVGLTRAANVAGRTLSAGQKRRTAFGRLLLIHRPIWLLDEPFAALDADGRGLAADLIAKHRASGGAVLASVHGDVPVPDAREVLL
ncbi:MAG: heme ABC exporter ATP-binding protein CcmA, partial [Pseudomonadota bacterium]